MAASPVKFLFGFLILCITLWLLFIFASRFIAWILSRVLGASVKFRVAGWVFVRDVVVKFKKGPVESISIGEIKPSIRRSLVKLGVGFISKDPKLQVVISDLEVVMRSSNKSTPKAKAKAKSGSRKSRNSGRGKWMVGANIARYLSVSITDLVLKTPKISIEVKELKVDISKDGTSKQNLIVKLQILPIVVQRNEPRASCDQSSSFCTGESLSVSQSSSALVDRSSTLFVCEEFLLSCEFGHDRYYPLAKYVYSYDTNLKPY
ncbi:hypothetical protein RchiOBHm_Chr7g0235031 [Rosa chinensis]|uniref:Uncharacterized protein n=1 Tax=Rosa chinensis TaxID=74649 RepID=A0A2P6PGK7_ROSCH|nr:hypothetical protein RchiOBHm_Chr7g0235031 [Rosa chinensis]